MAMEIIRLCPRLYSNIITRFIREIYLFSVWRDVILFKLIYVTDSLLWLHAIIVINARPITYYALKIVFTSKTLRNLLKYSNSMVNNKNKFDFASISAQRFTKFVFQSNWMFSKLACTYGREYLFWNYNILN